MKVKKALTRVKKLSVSYHYVLFAHRFAPLVGGVESYAENMARELVAQGNAATVVTSRLDGSSEVELRDDGVTVFRLPSFSLLGGRLPLAWHNARHKELMTQLVGLGVDRVVVNTRFYQHSLDGLRFAQEVGVPALVLDHGSAHITLGNAVADVAVEKYEHAMTKKVCAYRPRFAGVSRKSVEWLRHFGIDTDTVVPNAINAAQFQSLASMRNFRSEFGIADDSLLVLFVGRLTPEKGPEKLVEAANLLAHESIHFVFAGSGFLEDELKATAAPNVHFVGTIDRADLSSLLQLAQVFCLPTRSEGFCTSLLEASACGLVSVIPDVGGAQELIPDSSYGYIIKSTEPSTIAHALKDIMALGPDGRMAMGTRAQQWVEEHYNWASSVRVLEAAFEAEF